MRGQWGAAEAEARRLQSELDESLRTLAKWEAKFSHVRKLLDGEKREKNIVLKKYNELVSQVMNLLSLYDQFTFTLLTSSILSFSVYKLL